MFVLKVLKVKFLHLLKNNKLYHCNIIIMMTLVIQLLAYIV